MKCFDVPVLGQTAAGDEAMPEWVGIDSGPPGKCLVFQETSKGRMMSGPSIWSDLKGQVHVRDERARRMQKRLDRDGDMNIPRMQLYTRRSGVN